MKIFIKGEYVDLEKFHNFYYNETSQNMFLLSENRGGGSNDWIYITIKMTKEEYDSLRLKISNIFQIPILL